MQVVNRASSLGGERSDIDAGVVCPFFETKRVRLAGEEAMAVSRERFEILMCLEGGGNGQWREIWHWGRDSVAGLHGHMSDRGQWRVAEDACGAMSEKRRNGGKDENRD